MNRRCFNVIEIRNMERGHPVWIGNRCYHICVKCDQVVRINKPIVGSLHFCSARSYEQYIDVEDIDTGEVTTYRNGRLV